MCYLGILKEGYSPYSSPIMLMSQKVMYDKRVVTDFRHLNVRIVNTNLAYPLVKDIFSVLDNANCEAFRTTFKRCISFIMALRGFKKVL